jgi:DNA-binding IclR family transcriptional regulator
LHANLFYAIKFIVSAKLNVVPALDRGLSLMEWITTQSEPMTLTQVAHGVGLSVSEVQRPVACLLERGYLKRTPAGAYAISGLLYRLALSHPPHRQIQQAALPQMQDFARASGQSIHLCVPDGDAALLLVDVPGGGLVRISLQAGARLDANETVSGRMLQAHHLLVLEKKPGRSLEARLKEIRSRKHELTESAYAVGILDLGVPVCDRSGKVVAALTCSILRLRKAPHDGKNLLPDIKACAEKIGLSL